LRNQQSHDAIKEQRVAIGCAISATSLAPAFLHRAAFDEVASTSAWL